MKVLNKIALKSMKFNKKRTAVTIIAITISSVLMFSICFVFSTFIENVKKEAIYLKGFQHVSISNVNYGDIKLLKDNDEIKNVYPIIISNESFDIRHENYTESKYIKLYKTNKEFLNELNLLSGKYPDNDKEIIMHKDNCLQGQTIVMDNINYKIVGCFDNANSNNYYALYSFNDTDKVDILITYKNISEIREKTEKIFNQLNLDFLKNQVTYNNDLLKVYGASTSNAGVLWNALMNVIVLVTSTIAGVFILLVVYNSYSISIIERKKSFGILSSIGTTKFQLIKSMMFEAFIELLVGIIIGFIISFGLFNLSIHLINKVLLTDFIFSIYPMYLFICVIMLLIFVLLSSIMPSIEASFISPISVIRGNKDIKNKKIKNSLITKIFGIEGSIAYRNIKRNKRKYSVTTFSIILSFTIFVSFSIFFNLFYFGINYGYEMPNYDYVIYYNDNIDNFLKILKNDKNIRKINVYSKLEMNMKKLKESDYYNKFPKSLKRVESIDSEKTLPDYISVYKLYGEYEEEYLNKNNLTLDNPIYINYGIFGYTDNDISKIYKGKILNENDISFDICEYVSNYITNEFYFKECKNISNINYTNTLPFGIYNGSYFIHKMIVDDSLFNELLKIGSQENKYEIYLNIKDVRKFEKELFKLKDEFEFTGANQKKENIEEYIDVVIPCIVLCLFMIFIILFSIINIYNSISTTMSLRRREFAMLRSVGMNDKQFNKMIFLESIFYSFKSIIWGVILSLLVFSWFKNIYKEVYELYEYANMDSAFYFPLPLKYIIIASLFLILIVYTSMKISLKKENKGNIIDIIKEDY